LKRYRVYADTSVFGGCLDEEFNESSNMFFKLVREGAFKLIISPILLAELADAPDEVKLILADLTQELFDFVDYTPEVSDLRDKYIAAKVLTNKSRSDAEHIAYATIYNADFVVSWNFKHIVHFEKISGFNSVNLMNSYKLISIYSPKEMI
jgi:hypothetical protein